MKEFVAWAKQKGRRREAGASAASAAPRTWPACCSTRVFGLKPTLVAYRGTGPAVNDLIGGHVDYLPASRSSVMVGSRSRAARSSGIVRVRSTSALRHIPDVPAAKEAGVARLSSSTSGARSMRPRGTPKEIVDKARGRARQDVGRAGDGGEARKLGGTVPPKSERGPEYLRKTVASDIPRWAPILKAAAETTKAN